MTGTNSIASGRPILGKLFVENTVSSIEIMGVEECPETVGLPTVHGHYRLSIEASARDFHAIEKACDPTEHVGIELPPIAILDAQLRDFDARNFPQSAVVLMRREIAQWLVERAG